MSESDTSSQSSHWDFKRRKIKKRADVTTGRQDLYKPEVKVEPEPDTSSDETEEWIILDDVDYKTSQVMADH